MATFPLDVRNVIELSEHYHFPILINEANATNGFKTLKKNSLQKILGELQVQNIIILNIQKKVF